MNRKLISNIVGTIIFAGILMGLGVCAVSLSIGLKMALEAFAMALVFLGATLFGIYLMAQ